MRIKDLWYKLGYWIKKDGTKIRVKRMTDDHLRNTYLMLKRAGEDGSHVCFGSDMISDPCIECMLQYKSERYLLIASEVERRNLVI